MTVSIPGPRRLAPLLVALAAIAAPAGADLVVLVDGGVLKVESFAVRGEDAELSFPGGGQLVLPLLRVERVLDDEIEAPASTDAEELASGGAFELHFSDRQPLPVSPWSQAIYDAAKRHGLNPALVEAVVRQESAFDPRAVSHRGARGLMQLMPATGRRFGLRAHELFDPEKNLEAGSRYLAWLAARFDDDLSLVLAGYNAGEGTVARFGGVPPYRETRDYVRRISDRLGVSPTAEAGR